MELGSVDVAWMRQLLLFKASKFPNSGCSVAYSGSKLAITLPAMLDVSEKHKTKKTGQKTQSRNKKRPMKAELINSAWQFSKASV